MRKISVIVICAVFASQAVFLSAAAKEPNDTFYFKQWYLEQIHAPEAWDKTTGSKSVTVAVIDTRIDIEHEDLKDNVWTNSDEIPDNGIDDDENGYADDVHGWNFLTGTNDILPIREGSTDEAFSHGTLVASLIGARGGNGIGIAGVAWNVSIMPLVVLDQNGGGSTIDVAQAVRYAAQNGADVINLSIEGFLHDPGFDDAVEFAKSNGVLTVAAAGNGVSVSGSDLDVAPVYPACLSGIGIYGVIGVGGTDREDAKAPYSNYGSCVDVSAPGEDIFAARPVVKSVTGEIVEPGYSGGWSGTSVAAPLVSGVAALLKSAHPTWGPDELRDRIRESVTPIDGVNDPFFQGKIGTGRIHAGQALRDAEAVPPGGRLDVFASLPGTQTKIQIWSDEGIVDILPFGPADKRGAHVSIGDIDLDGVPEVIAVPATGKVAEWAVFDREGAEIKRGTLGTIVKDGMLSASALGGFVIADPNGGRAWGMSDSYEPGLFYPYGSRYVAGLDLLAISGATAFAPRNGGGRLVITDVHGKILVSAFPFGVTHSGRWALARMYAGNLESLVFSGPVGSVRLDSKELGQIGWETVTLADLEAAMIVTSSGEFSSETSLRKYDSWPHS